MVIGRRGKAGLAAVCVVTLVAGVIGLVVASSSATPLVWTSTVSTVTVKGAPRSYLLVRPRDQSRTRLPVLVVLHGRLATPEVERQRSDFPSVVGPALFVYPAGYQRSWNAGTCCAGALKAGVDDVGFVSAVVHRVLTEQPDADPKRVLLVGFSNGGRLAYRVTCADPQLFQAYAVVDALPSWPCAHRTAIPFVDINLQHDPIVSLAAATNQIAKQRAINGCAASTETTAHGHASVAEWRCRRGGPVQAIVYPGNVHVWPAGDAVTPPAESLIWDFFRGLAA
jgi:polyhydroxybutyrate depolymerase